MFGSTEERQSNEVIITDLAVYGWRSHQQWQSSSLLVRVSIVQAYVYTRGLLLFSVAKVTSPETLGNGFSSSQFICDFVMTFQIMVLV